MKTLIAALTIILATGTTPVIDYGYVINEYGYVINEYGYVINEYGDGITTDAYYDEDPTDEYYNYIGYDSKQFKKGDRVMTVELLDQDGEVSDRYDVKIGHNEKVAEQLRSQGHEHKRAEHK